MLIISKSKLKHFTLVVSCLWTPSKNYWVMWWNWCIISIDHLLHDSPCIYSNAVHFLLNSKKLNFGEIGKFPSWSDIELWNHYVLTFKYQRTPMQSNCPCGCNDDWSVWPLPLQQLYPISLAELKVIFTSCFPEDPAMW